MHSLGHAGKSKSITAFSIVSNIASMMIHAGIIGDELVEHRGDVDRWEGRSGHTVVALELREPCQPKLRSSVLRRATRAAKSCLRLLYPDDICALSSRLSNTSTITTVMWSVVPVLLLPIVAVTSGGTVSSTLSRLDSKYTVQRSRIALRGREGVNGKGMCPHWV
jgi:hypothetical protein